MMSCLLPVKKRTGGLVSLENDPAYYILFPLGSYLRVKLKQCDLKEVKI